jgi:hypothetical protein
MFAFVEALVVMVLLGYFAIELALPTKSVSQWFALALAPAVGAGICSLIQFLFRRPMFTVERGLLIALFVVWFFKRGMRLPSFSQLLRGSVPLYVTLFVSAVLFVLWLSVERAEHIPHGGTDAFAIWNSHSRYLYRDGPNWQQHIQNTFHPDYPLLLPSMVARLWRYAGEDVPDMGALFGVLCSFSALALLGAAVAESRGAFIGTLMAIVLLTTSDYMVEATYQEADVPLSVFFLGTTALLALYFEREQGKRGFLVLAGFLAGCAAWTKNEGLLFLAVTSAVLLIPVLWNPRPAIRRFVPFCAGMLLPLVVVLYFKFAIAPQGDLFQNRQTGEVIAKILDLDRHAISFGNILQWSWTFGGWAIHPLITLSAFLLWRGVDRNSIRSLGWRGGLATLGIVLAGYHSTYVFTPMPIVWHITNSLPRLLMQLWPSLLLLVGLAARRDREEIGEF